MKTMKLSDATHKLLKLRATELGMTLDDCVHYLLDSNRTHKDMLDKEQLEEIQ